MAISPELKELTVDINSLTPRKGNPRQGNLDTIKESLEVNGQYRPIVVNKRDNEILAGNHTWQAAKALGWEQIAATYVDVDDEQAARIVLIDNRANDLSTYDNEALLALLQEFNYELDGTGYTGADIDLLIAQVNGNSDNEGTDPEAEWENMPEFEQEDQNSAFRVTVHFASHDDADDFFKLIDRPRKSSMWWPQTDGLVGSDTSQEYVSED